MLPAPISAYSKRNKRFLSLAFLRAPSRVTNLAVTLLAGLLLLSVLVNIRLSRSPTNYDVATFSGIKSTVARHAAARSLNHLVVIPCHSIWKGSNAELREDEDEWELEEYQKGPHRVRTFFEHIKQGVETARKDGHSLLVFTGGQTKHVSTNTEGSSYLRLALATSLLQLPNSTAHATGGDSPPPTIHATSEDFALDSFQNLLFSIARFKEYTGVYPKAITVVGYEFKRARFVELHRLALRWPSSRFHYIGVDPSASIDGHSAEEGELLNGYLPYSKDLYGCHAFLASKRKHRNPHVRFHSYYSSSPELGSLLDWCPKTAQAPSAMVYQGTLPWAA